MATNIKGTFRPCFILSHCFIDENVPFPYRKDVALEPLEQEPIKVDKSVPVAFMNTHQVSALRTNRMPPNTQQNHANK